MSRLFLFILLSLTICTNLFSQDVCSPVGWATQNGGTTGGGSATPITVTTLSALQTEANSTGSKVIYVSGTMGTGVGTRVQVAANKTIIGLPGAKLNGGFDIKANNIIVRNMKIQGPGAVDVNGVDCITVDGATNVWIDHCELWDGQDGNMDIVNGSNYVSVTWCKFYYTSASSNHQFNSLFGNSDSKTSDRGKLKITMMYNWWSTGCKERMPRVRFGQVHVVNNYYNCTGNNHCVRAGKEADLLVEGNYFDGVSTPIDLYPSYTAVTSRNNTYVSTSGNTAGSGTAFTPPYTLSIAPSANVKTLVMAAAGATMPSPTSCGGTAPVTYTLTTTSSPTAGGTVSGAGTYNSGTVVTLTATPASGYTFVGWSGGATGTSATTTVTMNANKSVTATFQAIPVTYTLTATSSPTAGGTVSGAGTYNSGTVVTLIATPASGYTFTGWSGDATGTATTTTVAMNANKTVTATFQQIVTSYTLTTIANPAVGGIVAGAGTYNSGTVVTLTATPASGYTFTGWSGAATGTANTTTVTMTSNLSATANFQLSGTGGASTIRIEDDATTTNGLCLVEGSISANSGANNGKVINLTNSSAKGVNWRVSVPTAGTYTLNWRYVNSSTSNTYTMSLLVNAVVINAALPFAKTASSTVFANTTASVTLNAGNNTIRLESVASNATADIDWIEITGNSPVAGNCAAARIATFVNVKANEEPIQTVKIYPNPAQGKVNVDFYLPVSDKITISVIAFDGKALITPVSKIYAAGSNKEVLNIEGLRKGNYTVIIRGESSQKIAQKLIVL